MKRVITMLVFLTLCAFATGAQAAFKRLPINYQQGKTQLEGYLSFDDSFTGKRPAILIVHDWMGVGPFVQGVADKLAAMGFYVFCPDIYGKGVRPKDAKEAAAQAAIYRADRGLMRARVQAGLMVLDGDPKVDVDRIVAMGYCFGGGVILELARSGAPLKGFVSFHGNLDTPSPGDAKNIKGKVLVLHGADDPLVAPVQVAAFEEEMRAAKVNWQLTLYGGAVHAFTNPAAGNDPSTGAAYNEQADRRSWEALKLFLSEVFR